MAGPELVACGRSVCIMIFMKFTEQRQLYVGAKIYEKQPTRTPYNRIYFKGLWDKLYIKNTSILIVVDPHF